MSPDLLRTTETLKITDPIQHLCSYQDNMTGLIECKLPIDQSLTSILKNKP